MRDKYVKNNNFFSEFQKILEILMCGKKLLILEIILGLLNDA